MAAICRSNCRDCRCSTATAICRLSRLWRLPRCRRARRGSKCCDGTNFPSRAPMPQPASSDSRPARAANDSAAPVRPCSPLRPKLHHQPIRIHPWNCPRIHRRTIGNARGNRREPSETLAEAPGTSCRSARPARPAACADAGGEQRLQRARPAIVGAARQRQRRASAAAPDDRRARGDHRHRARSGSRAAADAPDWLAPPEPPARGQARRDKALLDLLPAGVLIYRLDRLLYANPAFLKRIGYDSLHALEEAGGLDALYVEPGVSTASSTSEAGTPVTISASHATTGSARSRTATAARLHTISWDDDAALALICSEGAGRQRAGGGRRSRRAGVAPAPAGRPATPMPKSSAPSSTPPPKAS